VTVTLAVLLTACGVAGAAPERQLVERAIALQLSQTQQALNQQLRLQPNDIKISHVTITEQTPLVIEDFRAYRVRGSYTLTIKRAKRQVTQPKNSFEVYLQRQKEGKTWRLARLQPAADGEPVWMTQRVQ